jgi:acyl carrier protein
LDWERKAAEEISSIIATIRRLGGIDEVAADQDFYDAGVSSLQALGLLVELEDAFAVAIPDAEFIKARTPRALYDVILAQRVT